jgi:hypothetical protein
MSSRFFRVGRSITGLGLFATKSIKREAYIATYRGRRITAEESDRREARGARYMFALNKRWVIDGSPRWNVARYINHSCRPNGRDCDRGVASNRAQRGNYLQLRPRVSEVISRQWRLSLRGMSQKESFLGSENAHT